MTTCRRCPAAVVFARTTSGKAMPLDADEDGQVRAYPSDSVEANVAVMRDATGRLIGRVLRRGEPPLGYERRAMPHFATCPGWR